MARSYAGEDVDRTGEEAGMAHLNTRDFDDISAGSDGIFRSC